MSRKIGTFIDRYFGIPLLLLLYPLEFIFGSAKRDGVKRILLMKLALMGDSILLYPAVRAIRKRYPGAQIDFVCSPINGDIVKTWKEVDNFYSFDFAAMLASPLKLLGFFGMMRSNGYDLAVDFEQWFRITPIMAFISGASRRIGFKAKGQCKHLLFTDVVAHERQRHEVDSFLDLAARAGADNADPSLALDVGENNLAEVRRRLAVDGIPEGGYVVVHPSSGKNAWQRSWPKDKHENLIKKIVGGGAKVVVTGTLDDAALADALVSVSAGDARNWCGKTSLLELAALVKLSKAVVCGNTGIMHMASALNKPLVAIHGPTNPAKWGPRNKNSVIVQAKLECVPCLYLGFEYGCGANRCMEAISVEEVFEAYKKVVTT
ncbi:MAG: glycosyltransferase family 9 protein [Endomicrobiales bacterium]|nr:glycosyltransferase family 9 protein [Endomicrobiales bacterium]